MKRPFFHLVWIGAAIVTAFFTPMIHLPPAPNERHRALTDLKNLESACRSYANEYGTYPSSNPVQFLQILRGGNTRGIVFVETPSRRSAISRQGEFVDPWGTPYRFSITTNQPPVFLSAGATHLFGDQDDLSTTN